MVGIQGPSAPVALKQHTSRSSNRGLRIRVPTSFLLVVYFSRLEPSPKKNGEKGRQLLDLDKNGGPLCLEASRFGEPANHAAPGLFSGVSRTGNEELPASSLVQLVSSKNQVSNEVAAC